MPRFAGLNNYRRPSPLCRHLHAAFPAAPFVGTGSVVLSRELVILEHGGLSWHDFCSEFSLEGLPPSR